MIRTMELSFAFVLFLEGFARERIRAEEEAPLLVAPDLRPALTALAKAEDLSKRILSQRLKNTSFMYSVFMVMVTFQSPAYLSPS